MSDRCTSRTRIFGCALTFGLLFKASFAFAAEPDVWQQWYRATKEKCPSHHLHFLYGDAYDELLGDFSKTLPRTLNKKARSIANYSRRCADETMGFYCEMSAYLDAYKKLGLLDRFATFGCRQYKCFEAANCVDPRTNKFQ